MTANPAPSGGGTTGGGPNAPDWAKISGIAAVVAIPIAILAIIVQCTTGSTWGNGEQADAAVPTPGGGVIASCPAPPAPATRSTVTIEAQLHVANVTKGNQEYSTEVVADLDDVVKFSAHYYNRGNVGTAAAENLAVRFVPSVTRGPVHSIGVQVYGENTNMVNTSTTVRLPRRNLYVEFVPGSAKWTHNLTNVDAMPDWQTQPVCDEVAGRGAVIEDAGSCVLCEATVTILGRVVAI
ncbi:hypothetical protein [Nocardia salmonicida]|uniref:hypothetical protein n=1 Tax=Nocardia salmonicida TaxID=53431 RepID=UPI00378C4098